MLIDVYLYNVGRNLNRAFRTCFSFGVKNLFLVGKSFDRSIAWELKGNLYSAKEEVNIKYLDKLPSIGNLLALENYYSNSIYDLGIKNWQQIKGIVIGGESKGIPKDLEFGYMRKIPTINNFCLTVEASLAIGLSEYWRHKC